MDAALIFVVVVAVKLVDPITLLLAACFAAFAAQPRTTVSRWIIILLGAALIVGLFAALDWRLTIMDGHRFRFAWAAAAAASVIQIWVLSAAFGAWRNRKAGVASNPAAKDTRDGSEHKDHAGLEKTERLPPVLYFKNGHGAFEYMCKYGRHEPIAEGCVRLAIVEPDDMRLTKDGFQSVWVKVADADSCFPARAITAAPNVPPLKGGELVHWFAVKPEPGLSTVERLAKDPRSWWQSWIVSVLAPEVIVATGALRTEIDYREFAKPD